MPGLLPLFWEAGQGKIYLEIPHVDGHGRSQELLYTESLPEGAGSNDLGLDRGQPGLTRIVRFERIGPKVLLVQSNDLFRTSSQDPSQQLAVRQSFPESVMAGFKVEAADPDGALLIDATDFALRDAHLVSETLTRLKQGAYKLDPMRSAVALDGTRGFPKNTEIEASLTFANDSLPFATDDLAPIRGDAHNFVGDVTPDPHAMTVHERQSFIELPGPGFTPRRYDARAGFTPRSYRDYGVAPGDPLDQPLIRRQRLVKKNPACRTSCQAIQPLQYYVDRGAPEPVRSALVEGARWWDQAFQAAGWAPGTFKVDLLPEDADPLDIRYNVIQWVQRYTSGYSWGNTIHDPRTGEIIKSTITLDALQVRQNYMFAQALLSPYQGGKTITPANDPMLAAVLQRIRYLAAHEVGHTLGLAHNFAASSFPHTPEQAVSVMDYTRPYITLDRNGAPDLSHASSINIGEWDKVTIDYGYREFPAGTNEREELNKILAASNKTGMVYITDQDSRPPGGTHPHANLFDGGTDPVVELTRILVIRKAMLVRFGENAIRPGEPLSQLEDMLTPLYLLHRYQTVAAIKMIGGLDYRYELRGDGQPGPAIVSGVDQKRALDAVLQTLNPETLTLPESLLAILPPRPPGYAGARESFPSKTGLTFDAISVAESAADSTLSVLLNPERANRIAQYHFRSDSPSLDNVLEAISKAVKERPANPATLTFAVAQAVELRAVDSMLALAVNPALSTHALAATRLHLANLLKQYTSMATPADSELGFHKLLIERLNAFERSPAQFSPAKAASQASAGMFISEDEDSY